MRTSAQKQTHPQAQVSSSLARPNMATRGPDYRQHPILHVQRTFGNPAVLRMLQPNAEALKVGLTGTASPRLGHDFSQIPVLPPTAGALQTKVVIKKPGDEYAQEADRISEQGMRMPEPQLTRTCACGGGCPRCQSEQPGQGQEPLPIVRARSSEQGEMVVRPLVNDVLRSSVHPLDPSTRGLMESRCGHDSPQLPVHPAAEAEESAWAMNTVAYPLRRAMVLGSGHYIAQATSGWQVPAQALTTFSGPRVPRGLVSSRTIVVQGRIRPPSDAVHGPLLDQYSHDTGLPRDTVTQHDPGYEAWLLGRPIAPPPINMTLDMPVPPTPAPDYSRDETQLGAWERANFLIAPQASFSCGQVINNGVESSFVTDIGIRFTQSEFQYFIARHIYENMNDLGRDVGERIIWRRIHNRVRQHAGEHFTRYRQVVNSMRETILQRFAALPTRNRPIPIPQQELEAYVGSVLLYLVARLHFELWQTTCDWERADYPNLLQGIPNVSGRFVPACDPQPSVPPEPIEPMVVTPGASRAGSSARPTRPSR